MPSAPQSTGALAWSALVELAVGQGPDDSGAAFGDQAAQRRGVGFVGQPGIRRVAVSVAQLSRRAPPTPRGSRRERDYLGLANRPVPGRTHTCAGVPVRQSEREVGFMGHDKAVAVREVRVVPPVPNTAGTPDSPWTWAPSSPQLDELADPINDGQREIADNVVLGYD